MHVSRWVTRVAVLEALENDRLKTFFEMFFVWIFCSQKNSALKSDVWFMIHESRYTT